MAPPVPVWSQKEAQDLFMRSASDCALKSLVQFQCVPTESQQVLCLPFKRLFKECTVKHRDHVTRKPVVAKHLFEVTNPNDNNVFDLNSCDVVEFVRSSQRLAAFYGR